MIEKIFNELFGSDFNELMREVFVDDKTPEIKNENEHSYYHKVADKYDNGKHVSHVEKEIKDGKVLKDVKETYQIEDKKENETCTPKDNANIKCVCDKKENCGFDIDDFEEKLKKASDLLEQAQETIKNQQKVIDTLKQERDDYGMEVEYVNKRNKELLTENKEFKSKFDALKALFK